MGSPLLRIWQRGVAVEQRGIAERNEAIAKDERDRATRNFKLAQTTAESLVFDIAQGLRDVQGMRAESVRKILETAKGTFERLAEGAGDEPDLQRSRSVMLNEFGDTYLTLGDLEQALKAYQDGLAIAERIAAADPANTKWQRDLSVSHIKLGDALLALGKLDDALNNYRAGLAIRERLAATSSGDAQSQQDLAAAYVKLGDVLVAQGKLDQALKAYGDALAIRERLATEGAGNPAVATGPGAVVQQDRRRADGARQARRGAQGLSQ